MGFLFCPIFPLTFFIIFVSFLFFCENWEQKRINIEKKMQFFLFSGAIKK